MSISKLTAEINGIDDLKRYYMPFLKRKGLFIPTMEWIPYGGRVEVDLQLKLSDTPEQVTFTGRVVWVTPNASYQHTTVGVGVEFSEESTKFMAGKLAPYLPMLEKSGEVSVTI